MAGLLGDVLPYVYSRGNALQRMLGGLLNDPAGSASQSMGLLADKSRENQNMLAQAFQDPQRPFKVTDQGALGQAGTNMLTGLLGFAPAGVIDAQALNSALGQHISRLQAEADDWAARKYKPNKAQVMFEGDGPTKGESMSIGGINANRRDRNVANRLSQIDALERVGRVAKTNPSVVESEFNEARRIAEQVAARDGMDFDAVFDAMLGQRFTGTQEWMSGPGSIGRAIRNTVEPHIAPSKPAPTAGGDEWMRELFGN